MAQAGVERSAPWLVAGLGRRKTVGKAQALIGACWVAVAAAGAADAQPRTAASAQRADDFAARVLAVHNRYRVAARVAPLVWDPALATAAAAHGRQLVRSDRLVHSPRAGRPGQGENLWRGTSGAYSVEAMIENWARERSRFRAGTFPAVSTTGDAQDVVHYSQMIWPATTHVGCALQRSPRSDFLVCRYSPRGNIDGRRVP
jgi:hypothetical protein